MNDLKLTKAVSENIEEILQYSWLDPDPKQVLKLLREFEQKNPLKFTMENFSLELMRLIINPDYFHFTCKHIFNIDLIPMQQVILKELWDRPFPILVGSRAMGKSFILGLYAMMLLLLKPKTKVVIAGAGFRQSKIIFEYMETIWANAPILRDLCGTEADQGPHHDTDRYTMKIGKNIAIAIPLGTGEKIRGLRATHIMADEFAMIPEALFETVISGFGAVTKSPVENIKLEARRRMLLNMGFDKDFTENSVKANQSILSGTAYYEFNHFAKYWKRHKNIIESRGDKKKLEQIFDGEIEDGFDWKDYSVIRIPYDVIPAGFMDIKNVARSKASVHSGIFQMEFGACFTKDSQGFFPRSLIESCCTNEPIILPSGEAQFSPLLVGNKSFQYVIGIDPAASRDNFSIVVLELRSDHRRIVYSWSTNLKRHKQKISEGQETEQDYYFYCARKVRSIMKKFPTAAIALDSQGGGITISEIFHNPKALEPGELFIWPIVDPEKEASTDSFAGLHILHMISFSDSKWVSEANNGMKADMENKTLLFPYFDAISIGIASERDQTKGGAYEGLEDCIFEIEELKDELSTIIMSETSISGRDRWDTPEIKEPGGKKGRLRKDRYSALLMANAIARNMQAYIHEVHYEATGGFAKDHSNIGETGDSRDLYNAPDWFVEGMRDAYR